MPCSTLEAETSWNFTVCVLKGFAAENMKMWKAHWDRQLYKALEHQYQMGLEALNENLPEIRVELTYTYAKAYFFCLLLKEESSLFNYLLYCTF
jgi:hypothetical protein